jgi:hypothetical protein
MQATANQDAYLTISSPGVGYGNGFSFVRNSDSAGINVVEYANDQTLYELWMADNPDSTTDMFQFRFSDYQSANGMTVPLKFDGLNIQVTGIASNFYSNIVQQASAFYTTSQYGATNKADKLLILNNPSKLRMVGSTCDITALTVSGYTGPNGSHVWIMLDTATTFKWGYGPTTNVQATGIAIAPSVTLSNGIQITWSGTSGSVGDMWGFRVFNAPTSSLGATTVNGTLTSTGFITGVALKSNDYTVSQLPAASAGLRGQRRHVTDSTVAASGNFGATVVGGGANAVPVFCTGSAWIIA